MRRLGCLLACAGTMLLLFAAGCAKQPAGELDGGVSGGGAASRVLRLATTTSTRDSGLLDELLPVFERENNCRVDVVAVGTGAALKLGQAGDADVLVVHAPEAEQAFMDGGNGRRRAQFMTNYFTILGPPDDPARVRGLDAVDALRKIAATGQPFVSRGDDSGTHKRERALWQQAGGRPQWAGYIEGGQGMGQTLMLADEKQAYVLADEATYLKFKNKLDLVPLVEPSAGLRNPYAVITVNPDKHKRINVRLADALADFLLSTEAQQLIAKYEIAGRQLFHPTAHGDQN